MLVMGLDTSLQRCSLAILKDGVCVGDEGVGMARGHAEHLAPMASSVLGKAGVTITDLDRIGVVIGPGGFTGVRVALAFARGLAIGTNVPVAGVTSLAALAGAVEEAEAQDLIAPIIDAKRGQVYAGLYDRAGLTLAAPFVASPEQALQNLSQSAGARRVWLVGSGIALLGAPGHWGRAQAPDQIDAKTVARLAATAPAPTEAPSPLYLRAPDAKPPKPGPFDRPNTP